MQPNLVNRLRNLLTLPKRARPPVGATPHAVVHREGSWKLLHYFSPQIPTVRHPLLLVPSLINRHYVLDLTPGKSFIEYMVGKGFDVYCIDWGSPAPEDRFVTFDQVVDQAIGRAVRVCETTSKLKKVHLFGYCMGGTLAAIYAALHPDKVQSLTAVAAPVAFDRAGMMADWLRAGHFNINAMVDATGVVPASLLQASFQLLRPTLPLAKGVNLIDRAWNDKFLDGFLALETWANDNVGLPGEFYRRYVSDLYQADGLANKNLVVSGHKVDLAAIAAPVLAVTFGFDSIAPAASCEPLLQWSHSARKEHVVFDGSHIGGMTSSPAAKTLWPQLSSLLAQFDYDPA